MAIPLPCAAADFADFRVTLRLVLIEDHEALREGLELLLGREGCDVVGTAGTAGEGRELIERLEPDVALVDIRLGDESGIDLTRELLDGDPARRIVLYTGSSDVELLVSGLDSGARGYALKEGTPSELKTQVGGERLEIHLCDDGRGEEAVAALASIASDLPFVEDGSVRVPVAERRGTIANAVRRLDDAGIAIDDIAVSTPTLDDVFLNLTGHAA